VADGFSILEKNIMKAKGLSDADIAALAGAGIGCRQDFQTVGDAATLRQLVPDIGAGSAEEIMEWATGRSSKPVSSAPVVVDTADVVHCVHCGAKQPKDYKSGDLCTACGKQAEPVYACYWCAATGPGRFCRQCGAEFLATADLDLGILLKRDGLAKDAIPERLRTMSASDKDVLWGRVRRLRG
jgi:hypothetical protein